MHRVTRLAVLLLSSWAISVSAAEEEAAAPQAVPPQPQTPSRVIALAPVLAPAKFSIENRGSALTLFPGGAWGQMGIDAGRRAEFVEVLQKQKLDFSAEMTAALQAALTENGVQVVSLDEISYVKDDPRTLEYKQLKSSTNLVLAVNIAEVGLYSGRFTSTYQPRFNVSFALVDRRTEDAYYEPTIYYGVDARRNSEDQILADPQYVFASYEQALQRGEDMAAVFRDGIRKVAALAAPQVRDAKVKP